jgi:hypothetical protein
MSKRENPETRLEFHLWHMREKHGPATLSYDSIFNKNTDDVRELRIMRSMGSLLNYCKSYATHIIELNKKTILFPAHRNRISSLAGSIIYDLGAITQHLADCLNNRDKE